MVVLIGLIIVIVIDWIVADFMKEVAYKKGYDDNNHVWALCFWLGLVGWLYVIALPDLILRDNQMKILQALTELNKVQGNDFSASELHEETLEEIAAQLPPL